MTLPLCLFPRTELLYARRVETVFAKSTLTNLCLLCRFIEGKCRSPYHGLAYIDELNISGDDRFDFPLLSSRQARA